MKVLLTGVAGFIGSQVAHALLERGDEVIGIDNLSPYYDPALKRQRLEQLPEKGFTFVEGDIIDEALIDKLFKTHKPQKLCHLAAQAGVRYSLEAPLTYEQTNNLGTIILFEACRKHGVRELVFASSSSVYGANTKYPFSEEDPVEQPLSIYAATKRYNELLARTYHSLHGFRCTGLRFFTVYGPWGRPDMALFTFAEAILAGKPVPLFNEGKHARDFTFITDVVAGVLAALDQPRDYELINLARGECVPLLVYLETLEKALGRKAKRQLLPMQPGDVEKTSADISKARRLLGYDPQISVADGVRLFAEWYQRWRE